MQGCLFTATLCPMNLLSFLVHPHPSFGPLGILLLWPIPTTRILRPVPSQPHSHQFRLYVFTIGINLASIALSRVIQMAILELYISGLQHTSQGSASIGIERFLILWRINTTLNGL